jgi:hypothetical protein
MWSVSACTRLSVLGFSGLGQRLLDHWSGADAAGSFMFGV